MTDQPITTPAEALEAAAALPAYDCDGDPCGTFDQPKSVRIDAIRALSASIAAACTILEGRT